MRAGGGRVDPADHIVGVRAVKLSDEILETLDPAFLDLQHGAGGAGLELQFHLRDHAGLAQTAHGGAKQRLVAFRRGDDALVALEQRHGQHMLAERARHMVVLAMHIHRCAAAQRGETGAGHDRRQPALRCSDAGKVSDGQARFGLDHTVFLVETQDAVHPRHANGRAAGVQAGVAIAAMVAKGGGGRCLGHQFCQGAHPLGPCHLTRGGLNPPPPAV